jgi:xanthine dehydrogenase YagR molybdenum-binding subunit
MGRFLNRNYSGYLVPTNADIPELDVLFAGEFDEEASPLGAKGLGELTAVPWRLRLPMPFITRPARECALY